MKRKSMLALLLAVSMTCSMTAATGTVAFASDDAATEEAADDTEAAADDADAADTEEASDDTTEASDDDQKAADEVGALIDKIYVQERTDTTDEDCKAAKEAWDKLTDAQKELVTGEEASPEYFGRDTGQYLIEHIFDLYRFFRIQLFHPLIEIKIICFNNAFHISE